MIRERTGHHTAAERREAVLTAATARFAATGLNGTSTEDIAKDAGISQPYLFRLFGTKQDLFLATVNRVCDHIMAAFEQAATDGEGHVLDRMGMAYASLMRNRDDLLVLLHGFGAAADPEVQAAVRERMTQIFAHIQQLSGASKEEVRTFVATGMLITILAAIDAPELLGFAGWDDFINKCDVPVFAPLPGHPQPVR
jgi:AcrR family transcriptional regulator